MALHAVAMVVLLYTIAPLVYPESRYPWFYKTVGVVQYVDAHGQLNRSIDIYQILVGFFAAAAGSTKWQASRVPWRLRSGPNPCSD